MRLFFRIDPRLKTELRSQRPNIVKGLVCVVVTSLLTAATIPLVRGGVAAIERTSTPAVAAKAQAPVGSTRAGPPGAAESQKAASEAERRRSEAHRTLSWISLAIIGMYVLKYWFTRGQSYYLSRAGAEMASNLRLRLFEKLQRLPVTYFNERRSGAIQSVFTNDVSVYQGAVLLIRDSLDGPVKAVTAFAIVLWLQWQLGLITLLIVPALVMLLMASGRRVRQAQLQVQEDLESLSALTQEAIQGTRVVKAFAAEKQVGAAYGGMIARSLKSQLRAARRLAALRPMTELLGAIALAAALYACGWLAYGGKLAVADIAALIFAMDVINQGFRTMGAVTSLYNQVQAAAKRIFDEVLDVEEEHAASSGKRVLIAPQGRIEFRNVSFRYPDGTEALRGVSFVIEPDASLALVGPSGAGKSTIADLLLRFYDPTEGSILFDGVDIRELDTSWYRSQMAVVPQHTLLFAGTVAENIRLGAPDADDAEVLNASRLANAAEFVQAMPNGFQTELGERGTRLSGGEMQRIAIARALVRQPAVLILDEATSSLDSKSEKLVQSAVEQSMKGRTTLFIAHRLTTAARADQILVLRTGEVIEQGSHAELMERDGVYAGMFRAFQSGVLDEAVD